MKDDRKEHFASRWQMNDVQSYGALCNIVPLPEQTGSSLAPCLLRTEYLQVVDRYCSASVECRWAPLLVVTSPGTAAHTRDREWQARGAA